MDFEKFKPFLKEFIKYYYDMPEKGAGGFLHIVLDDGNVDYSSIGKDVVYNEEELETISISGDIEMNVDLLPNRDNIF